MGVISGGVAASGNTCPGVRCPGVQEHCSPRYMNSQEEAELQSHLINSVGASQNLNEHSKRSPVSLCVIPVKVSVYVSGYLQLFFDAHVRYFFFFLKTHYKYKYLYIYKHLPYEHIYVHHISINTSKILSQFDFKIYEVDHQKHITID
jgi:hypothetical protein